MVLIFVTSEEGTIAYSLWHFLFNASNQVEILGVWVRQENPIYTSHEFVISCGAVGGPNMRFLWYKDNRKVGDGRFWFVSFAR